MRANCRTLISIAGLAVVLALAGCGSEGDTCSDNPASFSCPPPSPTPPPPPLAAGQVALKFDEGLRLPFQTPAAGTVTVEVNWNDPTNAMIILLTNGSCTFEQLEAEQCQVVGTSFGTSPRPMTLTVAGRPAGLHTLFVGNVGPGNDSITYKVTFNASGTGFVGTAVRPGTFTIGPPDVQQFTPAGAY